MDSRVSLLDVEEITSKMPCLVDSVDLAELNIFRALGNNPDILGEMLEYIDSIYDNLSDRDREIAILTVARQTDSKYEWHQHAKVCLEKDILTKETISSIGKKEIDKFEKKEKILIKYINSFIYQDISDNIHNKLKNHCTDREIIAIGHLCCIYIGLAKFLKALDIPLEESFIGWKLE